MNLSSNKSYPDYCSAREDQLQRRIPPLKTNTPLMQNVQSTSLKHVTTIIRHGSRTPWAPHQCWSGYSDPSADTSTWECTLTAMMRPQSEQAIALETLVTGQSDESSLESGQGLFFEFQKLYDANWSKDHPHHYPPNMGNDLGGNCQVGQLISKGHEQQVLNGKLIQKAYVKVDDLDDPEVGMLYNFLDEKSQTSVTQRAYDEPQLYFRSDDDERTLMSGQLLLEELFGDLMKEHEFIYKLNGEETDRPVIRVHTADRDKDVLSPNRRICPRLDEIEEEAMASADFIARFVLSTEAKTMQRFAKNELSGGDDDDIRMTNPEEAIDCIMTTICEDKTLPFALDTEQSGNDPRLIHEYGQQIFNRFIHFVSALYTFSCIII
jgi:ubiquitin-like domain-containing CTD phosphatase 1